MSTRLQTRNITMTICAAFLLNLLGACGGGSSATQATSGDPEADRRAELRVGSDDGKSGKDDRTLYDRLGGQDTLVKLVDDVTARVIADPRVNFERENVSSFLGAKHAAWHPTPENVDQFKQHMVEFLSLAAGGPGAVHRARYAHRPQGHEDQQHRV